jgi:hypothetical protein
MTDHPFAIRILGKEDRSGFCCSSEPLDRYFKTQVGQMCAAGSAPAV